MQRSVLMRLWTEELVGQANLREPDARVSLFVEGRTGDDLPVIGPSCTEDGLFHAFGFSAHGFQLGPVVGSIIADLVLDGATALPIEAFSIGRFNLAQPMQASTSSERDTR